MGTKDADAFHDLDRLPAIAKRPNVTAELGALPCYSTDWIMGRALCERLGWKI